MDKTPLQWMIEPLRRYVQFSGRARRAEYWWFGLFGVIVSVIASVLDFVFGSRTALANSGLIAGLASLALICPQLAVSVRRLHDIDRTGWWVVAPIVVAIPLGLIAAVAAGSGSIAPAVLIGIAIVGFFLVIIFWTCTRGTLGPNRFGPDQLADD